jgi:ABC-type sugar transport system substrate-binding protein
MQINRRQFSATLAATAASATTPRLARAEGGKTIALMFDAFDSDFWITGNSILKSKAKENGWTTLETISNRDQNKQNDQVKAMVERKVDGIVFIPTDNIALPLRMTTSTSPSRPITERSCK